MGCAVTKAEAEREREKTVFAEMTADWSAASEGPLRGLRDTEGTGISRIRTDLGRPKGVRVVWVAPQHHEL